MVAKPDSEALKPASPLAMTNSTVAPAAAATTWVTTYAGTSRQAKRRDGRQPDGHRGVEVPAADVADGVGHGEHGQAEGEGDAEVADADVRDPGGQDGGAAAAEHQPEGAEELGREPPGDGCVAVMVASRASAPVTVPTRAT